VCAVMCESVRLGGLMGVVMAWFCRLEAVGLFPYFLGLPRTPTLLGDILVVCRATAESEPGAGRVREGGEVISGVGLALPSRALVKGRSAAVLSTSGGLESGYHCCSVCSVCRFALLACFKPFNSTTSLL